MRRIFYLVSCKPLRVDCLKDGIPIPTPSFEEWLLLSTWCCHNNHNHLDPLSQSVGKGKRTFSSWRIGGKKKSWKGTLIGISTFRWDQREHARNNTWQLFNKVSKWNENENKKCVRIFLFAFRENHQPSESDRSVGLLSMQFVVKFIDSLPFLCVSVSGGGGLVRFLFPIKILTF